MEPTLLYIHSKILLIKRPSYNHKNNNTKENGKNKMMTIRLKKQKVKQSR
jgi:hypothetical protein